MLNDQAQHFCIICYHHRMGTKNSEAVNSAALFNVFQMCHTLMQPNAKFTDRGSFSVANSIMTGSISPYTTTTTI
jgi:hypothetical protein